MTRKLLTHAGIRARRLVSVHEHNEAAAAAGLVEQMLAGATVAVVSDAGMPGISDPGGRLVAAAAEAGVVVDVVPGPSAAVAALVMSGLPTDRFCFEGFLPRKGGERAARLAAIGAEPRTVVLYESPRRVAATIGNLLTVCSPDRPVAVGRELTKLHQQMWRGTLAEAAAWLASVEPRGEFVLVLGGATTPDRDVDDAEIEVALVSRLAADPDRKAAVAGVAGTLGVPKRRVYDLALRLRKDPGSAAPAP
jgi:16S rRNA (cytidine1402-2'-O)-methyltransferase